ncbi:MAG: hypothetical protein HY813_03095 [Candidatus Portnoybacteria bacterium]|nr:hypothetical protein [Candidatus Portnoybacteria bacterium]
MTKKNIVIPDSAKRFPDGANYRLEVSGIETPEILLAVIVEAKKLGIPIHRAIATVNGSKHWNNHDLKDLAKIAAKTRVEVIICPGHLARGLIENPNNLFSMMNYKNDAEIDVYWTEVLRCLRLGFRGFLVWRKSMLDCLVQERTVGHIPRETIFKVSTFDNNCNAIDFALCKKLGADTINSANGLKIDELAKIRQAVDTVMDVHITFWQMALQKHLIGNDLYATILAANPYSRVADAPEIARVCSPVYFKFEADNPRRRGISVYDLSKPDWTEDDLVEHKREDVRTTAKVVEEIKQKYPHIKLSDWGPVDLRVPIV